MQKQHANHTLTTKQQQQAAKQATNTVTFLSMVQHYYEQDINVQLYY
jgi:hypothetical protein